MIDLHSAGIFLIGMAAGSLFPSLPIPEPFKSLAPWFGFIFLLLGVILLMKT